MANPADLPSLRRLLGVAALLVPASLLGATGPFSVASGLFVQSDTVALGLSAASGRETFTVFAPSASTDHYSNGVVLVGFKGKLYCQWQSSAQNEDSSDTWVAFSRSGDSGKTWSAPAAIAKAGTSDDKTSGGWWVNGDTLVAFVNVWPTGLSPRGGFAYCATSTDGSTWSALQHVKMSDGTDLAGVMEQDPHLLSSGRILGAAHLQPGLLAHPIYTDDPSGVRGWKKGTFTNLSVANGVSRELEPSLFHRPDGTEVMVFRDQTSTYVKLAATSSDRGCTWTAATPTNYPDSRAKQSAGNLPDGTVFAVSNPVDTARRVPLAVGLSKDGLTFSKAFFLRQGGAELQRQRYAGKAKGIGYSYPKSTVWGGSLWAGYATNKEDVQVTRIPLPGLELVGQTSNTPAGDASVLVNGIRLDGRALRIDLAGPFAWELLDMSGRILSSGSGSGSGSALAGPLPRPGIYLVRVRTAVNSRTLAVAVAR